jgi:hypothetical protein
LFNPDDLPPQLPHINEDLPYCKAGGKVTKSTFLGQKLREAKSVSYYIKDRIYREW